LKLKLDENLGHRARALLEAAGHDVATVKTLIEGLRPAIARHLWIVEAGRIRIYQDPDEDPLDPNKFDR
jgi:hypothetical protein